MSLSLEGTKLKKFGEDLDIERERSINEKMKKWWAEQEELSKKPLDIMGEAKKQMYDFKGEDYTYYNSNMRRR